MKTTEHVTAAGHQYAIEETEDGFGPVTTLFRLDSGDRIEVEIEQYVAARGAASIADARKAANLDSEWLVRVALVASEVSELAPGASRVYEDIDLRVYRATSGGLFGLFDPQRPLPDAQGWLDLDDSVEVATSPREVGVIVVSARENAIEKAERAAGWSSSR